MSTVETIAEQALQLSENDRAELAYRLLRSLPREADELTEDEYRKVWGEEIERRLAEVDRGELAEGDWREVIARIRRNAEAEEHVS